ncbi:MAG: rhomboid family intramembrane serine protease [Oscillospiraceae bacterium]|nr:rhomboid family intramembrane serine protease [Clostridiales bacterium]MBD9217800.1 rhomboid family intramembrane serine protease [Clostridiales bacterium]MCI6353176.1 rhomboid family intramembrane serine protease [Bacillota bacterium]
MKKLYDGVQRFCAAHPRFGIPNLMRVIVIGNVAVYVLMLLTQANDANALSFLTFNLNALLHGEVWRLVTFVFVPAYSSPFALLISLYFYYWIGSTLERQWGTAKFNLYYISGALLTVLGVVLASLITGNPYLTAAGTGYVNLSMFFAFAFLFPDTTVLLFFILPVKMKWLAYLDGALFAFDIIKAIGAHNWAGVVLPIVALLNFAVFIWPEVHYLKERAKYQNSRKTVQFRQAQQQQAKQAQQQGYRHKCAVCGRTDTDYPDLQFRYCSKCVGYHCFCQDHIFNHVHFTEE